MQGQQAFNMARDADDRYGQSCGRFGRYEQDVVEPKNYKQAVISAQLSSGRPYARS